VSIRTEEIMRTGLALVIVVGLAPAIRAQEVPRAVLERAIAAHGGHEKLARVRADRVRVRGVLYVGLSTVSFTNEVTKQLPGRYRSVVQVADKGRTHTVIHRLDGDKASLTLDGQPQELSGSALTQFRQTLELESALRLVPLLNDPANVLTSLGTFALQGKTVVGIRVQGKGQRDLKLYFDSQSALLVKTEHRLDGPGGKDVVQEAYYSNYREAGGYRRPGRVAAYRDGKKVMEAELVEAVPLDNLPPEMLQQP
jgi:hypothetical protein